MAVVSGTEHEGVTEETINEANDQLFRFIDALNLKMDDTTQLIVTYSWQSSFDNRLKELQNTITKGENDIADTLSKVLLWMQTYNPTLDALNKERKELFGEGQEKK